VDLDGWNAKAGESRKSTQDQHLQLAIVDGVCSHGKVGQIAKVRRIKLYNYLE
jgi:hypothetical protein